MDILVKAAAVAIVSAILALIVKKSNAELSLILGISAGIAIMAGASGLISGILNFIYELADDAGISRALFSPVLKTLGLSIIGKLTSDICKDAGQSAASSAVEFCTVAAALVISMPLMRAVLEMLRNLT
ncbi:MAG: stage III sporulation AC/AD family protein [Oscillospiraceae bacterium]|jgi:stage III sporulation protein AD|nr:stage III sporulation AC/AD family protein [Oscillospiraceae bacterium]